MYFSVSLARAGSRQKRAGGMIFTRGPEPLRADRHRRVQVENAAPRLGRAQRPRLSPVVNGRRGSGCRNLYFEVRNYALADACGGRPRLLDCFEYVEKVE